MTYRFRDYAGLCLCAGMLVSGYLMVATPDIVVGRQGVNRERPSPPAPKPQTTISWGRPPVPLLLNAHTSYFVGARQPTATSIDGAITVPQDKTESGSTFATTAKAMIEADGYKSVSALVRTSDGAWAGFALRGTVEVAIRVDAKGNVSTQ